MHIFLLEKVLPNVHPIPPKNHTQYTISNLYLPQYQYQPILRLNILFILYHRPILYNNQFLTSFFLIFYRKFNKSSLFSKIRNDTNSACTTYVISHHILKHLLHFLSRRTSVTLDFKQTFQYFQAFYSINITLYISHALNLHSALLHVC